MSEPLRPATTPRIYYYAYDTPQHSGGEKHAYQHVDLLNASGFDACVLHTRAGFRHRWFDNDTRVIDFTAFWAQYDPARDLLVLPEPMGFGMLQFPGRKVIFNRNLFNGFWAFGEERHRAYPYVDPSVVAVLAVSEHNVDHLRFAFPLARVYRMYAHIDASRYVFQPLARKKRRIACVMKETLSLSVLYHTLMARSSIGLNRLDEYEWIALDKLTESQAADALRESLLLISLSTQEGLPRTVLEAMACGCVVLGYGSGPLRECLAPHSWCDPDDLIGLARKVEAVINGFPDNATELVPGIDAGRRIAAAFTQERQREHLVRAWHEILGTSASCPSTC